MNRNLEMAKEVVKIKNDYSHLNLSVEEALAIVKIMYDGRVVK